MAALANPSPILQAPEFTSETVAVGVLYARQYIYRNYPDFQRRVRLPNRKKQGIIDSILRGFPIPAPLCYREVDEKGVQKYYFIDGKQRLETIFEFIEGKFRTSSIAIDGVKPIEPGRYFRNLTPNAQNRLDSYLLRLQVWVNFDRRILDDVFRRMANTVPLSPAEKIMTYESEANVRADHVSKHPWIHTHLNPRQIDKSQHHFVALQLMALFGMPDNEFIGLETPAIDNLARGASFGKHAITHRIDLARGEKRTIRFLDSLERLAPNIGYVNTFDMIGLALSFIMLEQLEFIPEAMPEGLFESWLTMARARVGRDRLFDYTGGDKTGQMWFRIVKARSQKTFTQDLLPAFIDYVDSRISSKTTLVAAD